MAIGIFTLFVIAVLILSFYFARQTKSAEGYFAAGGQIHWAVNGISFAGDYLSAASFLGICGMIAVYGYDGFLYSIGYLAGWIVALFVVAEPMKRLGKYTFTDALDSKFNDKGIQFAAAISTLIVSMCYLIPQMVGAGVLVEPLLGLHHSVGVIMVGAIVIFIVATAGMASTTYVQFLKGGLLIIFSSILVISICARGITTTPAHVSLNDKYDKLNNEIRTYPYYEYGALPVTETAEGQLTLTDPTYSVVGRKTIGDKLFYKLNHRIPVNQGQGKGEWVVPFPTTEHTIDDTEEMQSLLKGLRETHRIQSENGKLQVKIVEWNGEKLLAIDEGQTAMVDGVKLVKEAEGQIEAEVTSWWYKRTNIETGGLELVECQDITSNPDGGTWVNGVPAKDVKDVIRSVSNVVKIGDPDYEEGSAVGPLRFLALMGDENTLIKRWSSTTFKDGNSSVQVFYPVMTKGNEIMRPGKKFLKKNTFMDKLNFASLMLALFFGTAALPHILIRYYTVPSPAAARKSTIVAIAAIGFFYVLTLFMGIGAMANNAINPITSNMSAPLLAKSISTFLFACISAIAFATVLGTVSGLIVAASGAIAHDLMDRWGSLNMTEKQKVAAGKLAAFAVGLVAIVLGIVFRGMNVSFLVGWAFAVAASANLPAIIMLLFWKKTTAKGIVASIIVGIVAALGIILTGPTMFVKYGFDAKSALQPLDNPGIISIPLSFLTLVVMSLMTQKTSGHAGEPAPPETPDTTGLGEGGHEGGSA